MNSEQQSGEGAVGVCHCPDCDVQLKLTELAEQELLECPECKKWTRPGWKNVFRPLSINV